MKKAVVNISRFIVAAVFLFSGFVKAVDPLGTQYKLQDYLEAMGVSNSWIADWQTLGASILLSLTEFVIGAMLLFAINRRVVSKLALLFMLIMTGLTVWIYIDDPVSDCGCFGDAIILSNGATLLKNIILLAATTAIAAYPLLMPRFISLKKQWMIFNLSAFGILSLSAYSLYYLPPIDFRPYHIGANIPEGMRMPKGAEQPVLETTFILEKNGERKEFTLDNYPDSTWTFIDSKTKVIKKGYEPPIHDFSIVRLSDDQDITEQVLGHKGYTILLIAPHLEDADDGCFGKIDEIYESSLERDIPFYCLTASIGEGIERWIDTTGAEYPFCNTDETTLKTIIRSNPGLVMLKDGTVVGKWSRNSLPDKEELLQVIRN